MKQLRYILSLLFFFLGSFSGNLKAEIIVLENEKIESFSEQDFKEVSAEKEWLGLLYLQEEPHSQSQYFSSNFSIESLTQNFSGEVCLKGIVSSSKLVAQFPQTSSSCQRKQIDVSRLYIGNPELVDSWKVLGEFPNLRKIPANLEVLNKVKSKFTYNGKAGQEALEEMFTGHKSAQKFIDNLNKAEELFDGVGIKQWTGIKSSGEARISGLKDGKPVILGKVDDGKFTVTASKPNRPDPDSYLTQKYIDDHLTKFTNERIGSRIVLKKAYDKYGIGKPDPDKTEFISLKSDMDRLISESNGDIKKIATSLGIDESQLAGGSLVRVDFKFSLKHSPHMPSGNEYGANEKWIPGGKLPEGDLEVIVKTKTMVKDVDYVVTDLSTGKRL